MDWLSCCGWAGWRIEIAFCPKGCLQVSIKKCFHSPQNKAAVSATAGWKCIRPAGVLAPRLQQTQSRACVCVPSLETTPTDTRPAPVGPRPPPLAETAGKGLFFCSFQKCHYVKTRKGESETILENAATTFWTMRSRRTHLAIFLVFSSNYELVCVPGACGSMTECFNLYKQAKIVKTFFFFLSFSPFSAVGWFSHVLFLRGGRKKKPCMFSIIWMKDILHCGILHWKLWRHLTVSFSKVWDSFWVLVCSQHCVFSASLGPCKCEDIEVSCK